MNPRIIYLLSAVAFLITAIFSQGYHHFDEHFQILEFASMKLGINTGDNLPWEFDARMRPAFQPWIAYQVSLCFGANHPFLIAFVLRLLSAALTFYSMHLMYTTFKDKLEHRTSKTWFLLLSFLLWFAVYNGVRFSSESWSGAFFTIGFAYFFRIEKHTLRSLLGIGICFGISFLCRYQSALLFGGLLLWILVMRKSWRMPILISMGVLLMMAVGFVLDHWLYGEWICTLWNYFDQNLLQGKASSFGVDPWYKYIIEPMMESIPTVGIVLLASLIFVAIKKYREAMLWCMVPFIGVHLLIGHKETRFLFPLIGLAPLAMAQFIDYLQSLDHLSLQSKRLFRFLGTLFMITNFVFLLVILFKPADNHIALYKCLYNEPSEPMVLNYIKHNPYHRVENVQFYKRSDMQLNEITDVQEIERGSSIAQYVATKDPQFVMPKEVGATLIFETYPSWIYRFNYNNWLKRSSNWRVYRLN